MSDEGFAFSTTGEVLMVLPVGDALKESRKLECPAYSDVFFKRARADEEAGNHEVSRITCVLLPRSGDSGANARSPRARKRTYRAPANRGTRMEEVTGSGWIRQGSAEVVRNGAQTWSTIAAETLTEFRQR